MGEHLKEDQAAGLRRLFSREQTRVVTFASGSAGVGKTALVANLAASLARLGKEVLVLDENTKNSVASYFGAVACHDLMQVVNREKRLTDVLIPVMPGIRILPAARTVKKLGKFSFRQQQAFLESICGMALPADVILVDTSPDHPLGFSPFGLAAHETVIVLSATSSSITDSYALIKKVSLGYSRKNFRILVNKARSNAEARTIHATIARVAATHGVATLDYAGCLPLDERMRQAEHLSQPVGALYPDTASAKACEAIAAGLLSWPAASEEVGGLEQFVQQLLHLSQHIDPVAIYA